MRYLALSAAASFYLAGTKASGSSAQRLFGAADHIAVQLGGATPDASIATVKVQTNETGLGQRDLADPSEREQLEENASGGSAPGPPHTSYITKRNGLDTSTALPFGRLVDELRVGVARQLATTPSASPRVQAPEYPPVAAPKAAQ